MSLDNLSAQTTRETPSSPMGESFVAPLLLPVCCLCGLIRDETESPSGLKCWVTQRTYRERHGVNPINFPLTHTYCPDCFTQVQNTVRQYFLQKIGTSI
jgi:hypothetical protein